MVELLRRRRDDIAALGFLFAVCTILFADVLFGIRALYIRDLTRYYYPTKRIIREVVLKGEFPFWNRYYSAGQPMAANPEYEVFYPPQWLIFLPDYDLGYRLHIVLHVYIAAFGMYAFLRSLSHSRYAAVFGAMAFGIGGVFLSMVNLLPIMFCAAWMPLIYLFARRFLLEPNRRDFALAGLMLGLQMLTAEPTTLLQTWFLLGCYGIFRGLREERKVRAVVKNLALVAAMGTAGLLVGGAQMFSALDHAGESARARPFDLTLVSTWSMHYSRPLELFFPQLFGYIHREGGFYWASGLYPRTGSPFVFSIYLGVLTAAFALSAAYRRIRGVGLVLVLCLFSFVIALGANTPLLEFLYNAGISSIRYFEKFSLMGLFAIIVLGSEMADRALRGDRGVARAAQIVLAFAMVAALGVAIFALLPQYPDLFRKLWGLGATEKAMQMVAVSRIDWWIAIARLAIAIVIVEFIRRRRFTGAVALVSGMLIFADLAHATYPTLPRMPANFFTAPPITARFEPNRQSYRLFHEADWYGTSKTAKEYFSTGDAIYWMVRNGLFPITPATWGFPTVLERDYDKTALLPTVDLVQALWKVRDGGQQRWAEMFMEMSNAWYRGNYVPLERVRKATGGQFKKGEPVAFERIRSSPQRYYFADRVLKVRDWEEFAKKLVANQWTAKTAYVYSGPFSPAAGEVLRVMETANRATIDVRSSGEAFLVMSVTPHKYWRATVDGRSQPLEVVNIGYQGLRIRGSGTHRVEMWYRNDVAVIAGLLSLFAFLALTLLAVFAPRRPARATDVPQFAMAQPQILPADAPEGEALTNTAGAEGETGEER